jgi:putative transposase
MRQKRPRLRTFGYVGRYRYFLTFSTHHRRKLFEEPAVVDLVLGQILTSAARCRFAILAYCLMPDHAHLLAKGQADNSDLKAFVKLSKQTSGYAYSKATGARLWQPSFHDRALRNDESDLLVIAYILRNPVAAGLVATWRDYPFLGSATARLEDLAAILKEGLGDEWETADTMLGRDWTGRPEGLRYDREPNGRA